ncbi:MAG: hypothetical protein SFZ02_14450 [bacterium]|nr:hypothetical protein [bacterium]
MDDASLLAQIIAEAKVIYASIAPFASPAHVYQEIDDLVTAYQHQYPTIITNIAQFTERVMAGLFGDE